MRELDVALESLQNSDSAIGAAVRFKGRPVWSGAVGLADRTACLPLKPGARVPIYSLTKTFTAVLMLRLAREGRFSLSDPARSWFPHLPLPETLNLSHLLKHTSGLRDYFGLSSYRDAVRHTPSHPWTSEKFLELTLPDGLLFAPGAGWAYSNIGYLLLLKIIEQTSRASFAGCVRSQIISPLNLQNTFVAETITDWQTCTPGYGSEVSSQNEAVDIRPLYHPGWCAPGVAVSTPEEMAFFYEQLLDGKILNEADLSLMCDLVPVPGHHPPAIRPSCGMGLLGDPDSPVGPSFGHGGGGPGYAIWASTLPRPSGQLSIMVFGNTSGFRADVAQLALLQTACTIFS